ncbi:MAG: hypothetical protein JSV86_15445 [Gemmatimonadota bacterium]|nr:MAG: hypothetical protein JSV86_15445 [Gemmatimonadota bacterium]
MPEDSATKGESRGLGRSDQPSVGPPIWRRLLDLTVELGSGWHPVHGGSPGPEPPVEPTALGEAEIVEGDGSFATRPVGAPIDSRFEFFLDGIEHTRICGYLGVVPIVHGYVAAVIRHREDRAFTTWGVIEEEVLAFPHALLSPDRFLEIGLAEEALIDVEAPAGEVHPIGLAEAGRSAVKLQRAAIERRLAKRWAAERPSDGFLLVDGRLAIDPDLLRSGRAIGLVKSHRTQFLPLDQMEAVLQMGGGHRSSVFKPVRPEVGEVYSWYLRLRPAGGHDIYWALARIEGRAGPETLDVADEVSRWLLAETAPLALPDPRWHVMLYPIRDCEQYLRARMPTLEIS